VAKSITIYLNSDDPDIKAMLAELKAAKQSGNPYTSRSESEIAKMLLLPELARAQKRFCGRSKPLKR